MLIPAILFLLKVTAPVFSVKSVLNIGINRQTREQWNLHDIRADHHMGQPDGKVSDVQEIKIRGGIQDTGVQAECSGRQDAVDPNGDMLRHSHVNDDRQDAEEERRG